jgi:hypothetical protein
MRTGKLAVESFLFRHRCAVGWEQQARRGRRDNARLPLGSRRSSAMPRWRRVPSTIRSGWSRLNARGAPMARPRVPLESTRIGVRTTRRSAARAYARALHQRGVVLTATDFLQSRGGDIIVVDASDGDADRHGSTRRLRVWRCWPARALASHAVEARAVLLLHWPSSFRDRCVVTALRG